MTDSAQAASEQAPEGVLIEVSAADQPASRGALRWTVIGVAVVALLLATLGFAGWFTLERQLDALSHQLEHGRSGLEQKLAQQRQATARNATRSEQLAGKVKALGEELDTLRRKLAEARRQQTRDPEDWVLAEARYLITLAGQRLLVAGDVDSAEQSLTAADRRLAELSRPDLTPVRQALQRDLTALQAVPRVEITGMALYLGEAIASLDPLPLKGVVKHPMGSAGKSPREAPPTPSTGGWRSLTNRLWQ